MSIPEEVKVAEVTQTTPGISPENDINWKVFREQRAAERKQAQEAIESERKAKKEAEALKAAMEALLGKNQPVNNNQAEYSADNETEEDRINKIIETKLAQKEREYEKAKVEREQAEIPLTMKKIYSDYDNVCSQDNIDYLEHHHPEIYRSLKERPDSVQKFDDAYKVIKKMIPNHDSKKDATRAQVNTVRPQSMNVGGVTQTSDTTIRSYLDQKTKDANHARMQRVIRGAK